MTESTSLLSIATFFLMCTQLHPLSVPESSLHLSECNFSEDDFCLNAEPVYQTGSRIEGGSQIKCFSKQGVITIDTDLGRSKDLKR